MKLSLISLLCIPAFMVGTAAAGTTIWANGVNEADGWYDVNKSYAPEDTGDDMMCYAAATSNLIAWWQNSQLDKVPAGTPTALNDIWATYKEAAVSGDKTAGDVGWALAWWISGVYLPTTQEEADRWVYDNVHLLEESELKPHEGFYYEQCSLTCNEVGDFVGAYIYDGYLLSGYTLQGDSISGGLFENKSFAKVFDAGYGVALGISDKDGMSHAITLWGVGYADDGTLETLWITDSDDTRRDTPRLVEATVYSDESNPGTIYFSTEYVYEPVEGNPDSAWEIGYSKESQVCIDSVYILNPHAFTVVPEPATATLGLLALAGLAARRRRK